MNDGQQQQPQRFSEAWQGNFQAYREDSAGKDFLQEALPDFYSIDGQQQQPQTRP